MAPKADLMTPSGALLLDAMLNANMTVPMLAARLGVTCRTIYRCMNAQPMDRSPTLRRALEALGVPVPYAIAPTGDQIAKVRARLGWTRQQLADACGVSKATVTRWERGTCAPRAVQLRQLAIPFAQAHHAPQAPRSTQRKGKTHA